MPPSRHPPISAGVEDVAELLSHPPNKPLPIPLYLTDSFDPTSLKVAELRKLLSLHNVVFNVTAGMKKDDFVKLFNTHIHIHRNGIIQEREKLRKKLLKDLETKPTVASAMDAGAILYSSTSPNSVNWAMQTQETSARRGASSRRGVIASQPSKSPSPEKIAVSATTSITNLKSSASTRGGKNVGKSSRAAVRNVEDQVFSDDNPFQNNMQEVVEEDTDDDANLRKRGAGAGLTRRRAGKVVVKKEKGITSEDEGKVTAATARRLSPRRKASPFKAASPPSIQQFSPEHVPPAASPEFQTIQPGSRRVSATSARSKRTTANSVVTAVSSSDEDISEEEQEEGVVYSDDDHISDEDDEAVPVPIPSPPAFRRQARPFNQYAVHQYPQYQQSFGQSPASPHHLQQPLHPDLRQQQLHQEQHVPRNWKSILEFVLFWTMVVLFVHWWVFLGGVQGYCKVSTTTSTPSTPLIPETYNPLAYVLPSCIPCPPDSICSGREVIDCQGRDTKYMIQPNLLIRSLDLIGFPTWLIPFPINTASCIVDKTKQRAEERKAKNVGALFDLSEEIVRSWYGDAECGDIGEYYLLNFKKGMPLFELKKQLKGKVGHVSDEKWNEYWDLLTEKFGKQGTTKSPTSKLVLSGDEKSVLTHLEPIRSWRCGLKKGAVDFLRAHARTILFTLFWTTFLGYWGYRWKLARWEDETVHKLVEQVKTELMEAEKLHLQLPAQYPIGARSIAQLRDLFLPPVGWPRRTFLFWMYGGTVSVNEQGGGSDVNAVGGHVVRRYYLSSKTRLRVWKKVVGLVERDSNVRRGLELIHGLEDEVWMWVGPLKEVVHGGLLSPTITVKQPANSKSKRSPPPPVSKQQDQQQQQPSMYPRVEPVNVMKTPAGGNTNGNGSQFQSPMPLHPSHTYPQQSGTPSSQPAPAPASSRVPASSFLDLAKKWSGSGKK